MTHIIAGKILLTSLLHLSTLLSGYPLQQDGVSVSVKAVVDRMEGEYAVILMENDEAEIVVPAADLPEGTRDGVWLDIELENGTLANVAIDYELTEEREQAARDMLERLKAKWR
ncbi:DUF3006 domain-containing protein [Virgibacillus sediminis]|uniref:DUF3006 domain-containing protein n=1 Tax=Virgibacillus sediminis TaxID=202260 RepID=A0ABV7A9G2_9BACI